ncbi:MAG: DinB family protein [Chitinophagales bacterium]
MTRGQQFRKELLEEAVVTRKMLALVPDQKDFQPHQKSMKMERLATHIAEIAGWSKEIILQDELDFNKSHYKPKSYAAAERLVLFDKHIQFSADVFDEVTDEELNKPWCMRQGEVVFFTMAKGDVVRTWMLNHMIHHRAQLGVYLRLLEIPLPGSYGPSADEQ